MLMRKIILIPLLLCLVGPLKALEAAHSEPLETEFQKLLPSQAHLARVQHLKLPGLPRAVLVVYAPNPKPTTDGEADAVLLAQGSQGPYKVWRADPVNAWPEPFSGVYFLGLGRVPIFLFCHEFGASVGVHMEAYRWDGKTFKSLGTVPCDGYTTLQVVPTAAQENMVVLKGRYHYVDYFIYREGRLMRAPKDYVKKYYSYQGKTNEKGRE